MVQAHLGGATETQRQEMGKVIVMNWVTLDGVMQGPGRPDEDTRDGFERGGWGIPYGDEATVAKMGERMGGDRAFLFGRRTYEQLLVPWNARGARSRTRSTTLASTSPRVTPRRGSTGRTRLCFTGTLRPPWRTSSKARARIS